MNDAFERATQRTADQRRERRRRHVAAANRKGFRIHATVFFWVQLLLVAVWALQWLLGGTAHPWFLYALVGWGIGLAIHYRVARKYTRSGPEPSDASRNA